jgi:DNA replication protein DnaC
MAIAHQDGSVTRLRTALARFDLLILDDFGLTPLTELTLIDDRLAVLDADKASCTEALAKTSVKSFADVVGKLDVASRILSGEGGLVHNMVADAVTHLPRFFADRPDIP